MSRPGDDGRQIAVVPKTEVTAKLAKLIAPRARQVGIEIALVSDSGSITYVENGIATKE